MNEAPPPSRADLHTVHAATTGFLNASSDPIPRVSPLTRLSAEAINLLRADGTAIWERLIAAVVPFKGAPELFTDLPRGAGANGKPSSPSTPR